MQIGRRLRPQTSSELISRKDKGDSISRQELCSTTRNVLKELKENKKVMMREMTESMKNPRSDKYVKYMDELSSRPATRRRKDRKLKPAIETIQIEKCGDKSLDRQ